MAHISDSLFQGRMPSETRETGEMNVCYVHWFTIQVNCLQIDAWLGRQNDVESGSNSLKKISTKEHCKTYQTRQYFPKEQAMITLQEMADFNSVHGS